MKIIAAVALTLALSGCVPASQFLRGFEAEGLRQLHSAVAESVNEGFSKLPPQSPAPSSTDYGVAGGLGALIAYVLGSLGKGYLRSKAQDSKA